MTDTTTEPEHKTAPDGALILLPKPADLLARLRALIEEEADVLRVLELEPTGNGRFRYLIETPFPTFPRFVLGTTDAHNDDVRIGARCGAEWNARRLWAELAGKAVAA